MISERKADVEVRYIFIKKFEFRDSYEKEALCGHPLIGRIYRSVFNVNTKHHRLLLPDGVIMGFDTLVGSQVGADFELIDIDITNILDFDITEEDLSLFLKPNTDIFNENIVIGGLENLQNAINQNEADEDDASHRASHIIMDLYRISPQKFEIILELSERLIELELHTHEDIAHYLRYDPEKGLALNIAPALRALDTYAGTSRKTSQDPEDLYEALESIIVELERVNEED